MENIESIEGIKSIKETLDLNAGKSAVPKGLIKAIEPYLYLIPCIIVFIIFTYWPFIETIGISLFNTDAQGRIRNFVGLSNYLELFRAPSFLNSILVTFEFVFLTTIPSIFLGFVVALLGNNKLRLKGVFNTMFAMPMAVSSASAAIIWLLLFNQSIGLINYLLKAQAGWLTDPFLGLAAVSIVTVWMNISVNFIFLTSGLKTIPRELYEGASIDGASFLQCLRKITIPCLSPTLFFVLVINVINAFQTFGQINIMTLGGPGEATNVMVFSIYRNAFFNNRFDLASAQSIILFFIMLAVTLIQFRYENDKVFYK